jgi:hypothetical protein
MDLDVRGVSVVGTKIVETRPVVEAAPVLTPAEQRALSGARRMALAMDAKWGIGSWRFGIETITDFIPGLGDVVSAGVSVYQLGLARKLGMPGRVWTRMAVNAGVDLGLGVMPVVGGVGATLFKAHVRNQRILDRFAGLPPPRRGALSRLLWPF